MNTHDDLTAFERDVLESVRQAQCGQFTAVHTPEQIAARKRGRPVGTVAETRKTSITIRIDTDIMQAFRHTGSGWQTRVNALLREAVEQGRI